MEYETNAYQAKRIGPLRIEVPDKFNPDLVNLIIEEERKRKEQENWLPLYDYDIPYAPLKEKPEQKYLMFPLKSSEETKDL